MLLLDRLQLAPITPQVNATSALSAVVDCLLDIPVVSNPRCTFNRPSMHAPKTLRLHRCPSVVFCGVCDSRLLLCPLCSLMLNRAIEIDYGSNNALAAFSGQLYFPHSIQSQSGQVQLAHTTSLGPKMCGTTI